MISLPLPHIWLALNTIFIPHRITDPPPPLLVNREMSLQGLSALQAAGPYQCPLRAGLLPSNNKGPE